LTYGSNVLQVPIYGSVAWGKPDRTPGQVFVLYCADVARRRPSLAGLHLLEGPYIIEEPTSASVNLTSLHITQLPFAPHHPPACPSIPYPLACHHLCLSVLSTPFSASQHVFMRHTDPFTLQIKYLRVPDQLLDTVKEEQNRAREANRSARGGAGQRGGSYLLPFSYPLIYPFNTRSMRCLSPIFRHVLVHFFHTPSFIPLFATHAHDCVCLARTRCACTWRARRAWRPGAWRTCRGSRTRTGAVSDTFPLAFGLL